MEIATVLFTYSRPYQTKKVLDALKLNDILPSKLIIFQDGLKETTNKSDWEEVGEIIKKIKCCNAEIHIASKNKGLSESIVYGVTYALKKYDAVIVLEDDCVPHPKFMSYMISGLKKYREKKQVYSVEGGETWPINLHEEGSDAFFCGRISSYGWATWKDRWEQYERDYMILKKIKNDPQMRMRLEIWGGDLEKQLIGNITGKSDSWAVFWALKVIEKGGYCLRPYRSLIHNIGFDGTGVHSGIGRTNGQYRSIDNMDDLILPDRIEYNEECKRIYKMLVSNLSGNDKLKYYQNVLTAWVSLKQKGKDLCRIGEKLQDSIAVWGKGCLCDLLIQEWGECKKIEYIIESNPSVYQYHNIPVIPIDELPFNVKTIIVMPVYAIESIRARIRSIRENIYVIGIDELISEAE